MVMEWTAGFGRGMGDSVERVRNVGLKTVIDFGYQCSTIGRRIPLQGIKKSQSILPMGGATVLVINAVMQNFKGTDSSSEWIRRSMDASSKSPSVLAVASCEVAVEAAAVLGAAMAVAADDAARAASDERPTVGAASNW
eukprot:scaffold4438_cov56-Cyclotella_meneghiniana.AAC.13